MANWNNFNNNYKGFVDNHIAELLAKDETSKLDPKTLNPKFYKIETHKEEVVDIIESGFKKYKN